MITKKKRRLRREYTFWKFRREEDWKTLGNLETGMPEHRKAETWTRSCSQPKLHQPSSSTYFSCQLYEKINAGLSGKKNLKKSAIGSLYPGWSYYFLPYESPVIILRHWRPILWTDAHCQLLPKVSEKNCFLSHVLRRKKDMVAPGDCLHFAR